jgi:hypothetical protein
MVRWFRSLALAALLIGALTVPALARQDATSTGSITIRVFACPDDATRDEFDPAACQPIATGFDAALTYDSGHTTATLDDAERSDDSFTWSGLYVAPNESTGEGDPSYYRIEETRLPSGYADYVVSDAQAFDPNGQDGLETYFSTRLVSGQPDHVHAIYNFRQPPPPLEPATVTIDAFVCPAGYTGRDYAARCTVPAAGEWFRIARAGEKFSGGYVFGMAKADADGTVTFTAVRSLRRGAVNLLSDGQNYMANGEYVSLENVSHVALSCQNAAGVPVPGQLMYEGGAGLVTFRIPLAPGDAVHCGWYNLFGGKTCGPWWISWIAEIIDPSLCRP